MIRYGYFDSEITGVDDEGMPIFDRAENSEFIAAFLSKLVTSGVSKTPEDSFKVISGGGMNLTVRPGFAVIQGRFAMDAEEETLTIDAAPSTGSRLDRIVLRADYPRRLIELAVVKGAAGSDPAAPDIVQPDAGDTYEIGLAVVRVKAGASTLSESDITDTRFFRNVCGAIETVNDPADSHLKTYTSFGQIIPGVKNEDIVMSDIYEAMPWNSSLELYMWRDNHPKFTFPANMGGKYLLFEIHKGADTYGYIQITDLSNNASYTRTKYGGSWSAWSAKVSNNLTMYSSFTQVLPNVTAADLVMSDLYNAMPLNSMLEMYTWRDNHKKFSFPAGLAGKHLMFEIHKGADAYGYVRLTDLTANKSYTRTKYGAVWSEWST